MGTKKLGRPTNNPKLYQKTIRFDEECKQIIDLYCKKENTSIMETVRRGVKRLKSDL